MSESRTPEQIAADVDDGAFGQAAYCHHRHHLDEHTTNFDTCPHSICRSAREAAARSSPPPSWRESDEDARDAADLASHPASYATGVDHYREMARRFSESRDELKHENRKLKAWRESIRAEIEKLRDDARYIVLNPDEGGDKDWFRAQIEAYDAVLARLAAQPGDVHDQQTGSRVDRSRDVAIGEAATGRFRAVPKGDAGAAPTYLCDECRTQWLAARTIVAAQPRGESREEFERDRFGETGERLAAHPHRIISTDEGTGLQRERVRPAPRDDRAQLQRWRNQLAEWLSSAPVTDEPPGSDGISGFERTLLAEMDAALASPKETP